MCAPVNRTFVALAPSRTHRFEYAPGQSGSSGVRGGLPADRTGQEWKPPGGPKVRGREQKGRRTGDRDQEEPLTTGENSNSQGRPDGPGVEVPEPEGTGSGVPSTPDPDSGESLVREQHWDEDEVPVTPTEEGVPVGTGPFAKGRSPPPDPPPRNSRDEAPPD